jgi:hypothetical protein
VGTPGPTIYRGYTESIRAKALADTNPTATTILASIGDRPGLFKDLTVNAPASRRCGEQIRRTRRLMTFPAVLTFTMAGPPKGIHTARTGVNDTEALLRTAVN